MARYLRFLVFLVPVVSSIVTPSGGALAQDQAPPCPAYVIEGTIDSTSQDGSVTHRFASAYLHTTGVPLPSRQVIASFANASGSAVGEPVILVTDSGGRARVTVPASAESVNFVAESPDGPGCSGADGGDPRVLLEIVPTGVGAPGGGDPNPEEVLARTGPVSDVIALISLLLLAFGAAVGTGRGRRRALDIAAQGAKRGSSR